MSIAVSIVRRAAVAVGIVASVVGLGATTAQAGNQPTLSVSVSCDSQTGQQVIHWSYTNVGTRNVSLFRNFDAFSGVQLASGSMISVQLQMSPDVIAPSETATATSFATPDAVGTVNVVVQIFDAGIDRFLNVAGTATLTGCEVPTTTAAPTTTTAAPTTVAPTTTAAPGSQAPLPETGGDNSLLPVAAGLLGTGVVLLAARRRLNA
ncbi:MAG: LPXTG cell wall anchor domain-containing protein [Actinomycetota bacterium]